MNNFKILNQVGVRQNILMVGFIRPRKINVFVLVRKKRRKMTRMSANTISSEKCMHFTCFPRLII